ICFNRGRQQVANAGDGGLILRQAPQKLVRCLSERQRVQACQSLAMLLHLVGTEQLGPQRWLIAGISVGKAVAANPVLTMEKTHWRSHSSNPVACTLNTIMTSSRKHKLIRIMRHSAAACGRCEFGT